MGQMSERGDEKSSDTTVSAAGMRIIKLLVGKEPQTVAQLIQKTGVTRTAVTEQLNELVAAGFAERTSERLSGRGRPRHLYTATNAALLLLFASNQHVLVPAMWRAIAKVGGESLKARVQKQVSEELADHYAQHVKGRTPAEKLRNLTCLFHEEGNLTEIEEGPDGQLVMSKRSCAFYSMFEASRSVCCVDEAMMSRIVGAPVRRTACRHDGAPCCQFELVSPDND